MFASRGSDAGRRDRADRPWAIWIGSWSRRCTPENILQSVCDYFGLEHKDLMSGRRQRTISLARSVAMFLVRKTAKLSFPEIGFGWASGITAP